MKICNSGFPQISKYFLLSQVVGTLLSNKEKVPLFSKLPFCLLDNITCVIKLMRDRSSHMVNWCPQKGLQSSYGRVACQELLSKWWKNYAAIVWPWSGTLGFSLQLCIQSLTESPHCIFIHHGTSSSIAIYYCSDIKGACIAADIAAEPSIILGPTQNCSFLSHLIKGHHSEMWFMLCLKFKKFYQTLWVLLDSEVKCKIWS